MENCWEYGMTTWLLIYMFSLLLSLAQSEIHFTVEPHQGTHIRAGSLAKFTCSAVTDYGTTPKLIIEWQRNEEPILYQLHSRYVESRQDRSLTIYNTTIDDTGVFTCIARFGEYKVKASAQLVVQDVPDAPVNVRLENCRSRLAQISWQLLNENNSPVQFFIIQYNTSFQPDKWSIAKTAIPRERYIERIALSPWGNYSFRVIARNAQGDGPPSKPTKQFCQAPPDVPQHNPHDVCTANDVPGKLIIIWKPMPIIKHNAPGFHYVVRWKRYDIPETSDYHHRTVESDKDRTIVDDQPIYKPYEILVLAVNSIGKAMSIPHSVIGYSGEDVPLDAPNNFELDDDHRVTNTTAHFMWEPVQTSVTRVRGFFRGYRIEFWKTENPSHRKIHDIILDEPDLCKGIQKPDRKWRKVDDGEVHDLWPNSNITAHIRVLNMKYTGPPSKRITFVTEEGVPEYVQNARIISIGSTHFILTWQKPNITNGELIGYRISYKVIDDYTDDSPTHRLEHISDPDQTQVKLMGLRPHHTYQISVCARTRRGCGKGYPVEADTLPNAAPGMPSFTAININKTMLNVTWLPSNKGDPGCKFSVSYRQLGKLLWRHTDNIIYEDWVVIT